MVGYTTTTALAVLLGLQQAAATGGGHKGGHGWTGAPPYQCPGSGKTPPTVCTPQQASGWNWSGLSGGSFSSYDGCGFSGGWKYSQNGLFGRDSEFAGRGLEVRTGGGCASADLYNKPSFTANQDGRSFGEAVFSLQAEYDIDVEMEFTQRGGGKCVQNIRCGKQPTSHKNTQCGDCTGVTFKPRPGNGGGKGKGNGGGKGKGGGGCGFGVSSISYACSSTKTFTKPPKTYKTTMSTVSTTPVSPPTTVVTTTSTPGTLTSTGAITPPTTASSPPVTTVSVPTTSTAIVSTATTVFSSSTVVVTVPLTITSCGPEISSCPADSTVVTSSVVTSTVSVPVTIQTTQTIVSTDTRATETTVYTTISTTICPVTETKTSGNTTYTSTYLTTSTVPITYTTTALQTTINTDVPPPSTSTTAGPSTPSPPPNGGGCPGSVPSCLNTWLETMPECKDNTDAACYCTSANFTSTIIDCLEAYSGADVNNAIAYFQGICAPHAGENPQPFTGVPSTITITAPATSIPMTTVTVTGDSTTATITVPAVSFSSNTDVPEATVPALVPAGGSTTIPIVGGGSPATETGAVAPPTSVESGVATGTGSFTVPSPSTTLAIGAGSRSAVSGGLVFAAFALYML